MADRRSVVVYGASGFSGRLVAEFRREYNVPFVAAGRDRARLEEVLDHVPGISTADYEIVEVGHTVSELTDLLRGAKVVCNTVGPCIYYGDTVIADQGSRLMLRRLFVTDPNGVRIDANVPAA